VKITIKLGLPQAIVNAVSRDPYTRGDAHISVTGLIAPARKRMLEIVHGDQLTEDAADRIWALMGQITHGILERHDADAWTEERLYITRHGWRISGQFDRVLLEDGLLDDYKLTSTYSIRDGAKVEWEAQENIYKAMLSEHGHQIRQARVVAILRDWQKSKAQHDDGYPQAPVVILPVTLWEPAKTEAYILSRLQAHAAAQHVLPLCSPEERWERPAKFALLKDGNKRATSLHDTRSEADVALKVATEEAKKGATYRIDERPAEQVRCRDYCAAAPVCQQWMELTRVQRVMFAA
jgi:hypothetical protein